ncbi:hypothetical protein HY312_03940 [Candidatus Saccharibacteria bacterium]|nr:hypothetical protein [Candidatus Saccharibacteria bacterium]
MSTAEWFSPDVDAAYERPPEIDATELFTSRPDILAHFYFDFYREYCRPTRAIDHECLLSLGEAASSVVVARQDYSVHPSNPDAYLIKQYDLHTSQIHDWHVTDTSVYQGSGDTFERTLLLGSTTQSLSNMQLHLSSKGNQWVAGGQAAFLDSAHFLPFKAMHNLKLTEIQLQDFYKDNEYQMPRRIGKSALYSVQ